ncbi:MAG: RNA 3'-terminal phosphate cyclase [Amphiamblys sp. WSBS2006]|nr:MAG: RNA 3'-terminal phosphate cyclase [Amphiamblys sp. WSBS2006]
MARLNKGMESSQRPGCQSFREKVVLSVLSGKPTTLALPLHGYEEVFLRLVQQMSQTRVERGVDWVAVQPGSILGTQGRFDCGEERGIGYFLEYLPCLCLFAADRTELVLTGLTNTAGDVSVDAVRTVHSRIVKLLVPDAAADLKINRRGFGPNGGGEVAVKYTPVTRIEGRSFGKDERVSRVKGIACTARVAPQMARRMILGVRAVLSGFLPDIFIHVDAFKGDEAGRSPGYSVCLVSECGASGSHFIDAVGAEGCCPEDVGREAAESLLKEIHHSGVFGRKVLRLVFMLLALSGGAVCRVKIQKATRNEKELFALLEEFLGVVYSVDSDNVAVCVGCGLRNYSLRVD